MYNPYLSGHNKIYFWKLASFTSDTNYGHCDNMIKIHKFKSAQYWKK